MDRETTPRAIPLDGFAFSPDAFRDAFLLPVGKLVALRIFLAPPRNQDGLIAEPTLAISRGPLVNSLLKRLPTAVEITGPGTAGAGVLLEVWPGQEMLLIEGPALEIVVDVALLDGSTLASTAIANLVRDVYWFAQAECLAQGSETPLVLHVDVRSAAAAFKLLDLPIGDALPSLARLEITRTERPSGTAYLDRSDEIVLRPYEIELVGRVDYRHDIAAEILRDTSRLLGVHPHKVVPVYYATNRLASHEDDGTISYDCDRGESDTYEVSLGICRVAIPSAHRVGRREAPPFARLFPWSWHAHEHLMILGTTPLDYDGFFSLLRAGVSGASRDDILLFIHGFHTTFPDAIRRAAQLADDIEFPGETVVFSWPSMSVRYTMAEENADWSVLYLERFLRDLRNRSGSNNIHILAHSMGNRTLVNALSRLAIDGQTTFSEIVLAAADMSSSTLRDHARSALPIVTRVTLYSNSGDLALWGSQLIHGSNQRAGERPITGVERLEAIDASNRAAILSLNHDYAMEDVWALFELQEVLNFHLPATDRLALRARPEGGWAFRDDLKDLPSRLSHLAHRHVTMDTEIAGAAVHMDSQDSTIRPDVVIQ